MSSDDIRPRREGGFRQAGPGIHPQLRCGKCNQPMPNLGRRRQMVRGAYLWVGKCCQVAKPKATEGAPA